MSTLKVNNIQDTSGGATTLVSAQNTAKAWVSFNGTGTVAIRESYNVTSITDEGTGEYAINFTTAMTDAEYAIVATGTWDTTYQGSQMQGDRRTGTHSASTAYMSNFNAAGSALADTLHASVAVFR